MKGRGIWVFIMRFRDKDGKLKESMRLTGRASTFGKARRDISKLIWVKPCDVQMREDTKCGEDPLKSRITQLEAQVKAADEMEKALEKFINKGIVETDEKQRSRVVLHAYRQAKERKV